MVGVGSIRRIWSTGTCRSIEALKLSWVPLPSFLPLRASRSLVLSSQDGCIVRIHIARIHLLLWQTDWVQSLLTKNQIITKKKLPSDCPSDVCNVKTSFEISFLFSNPRISPFLVGPPLHPPISVLRVFARRSKLFLDFCGLLGAWRKCSLWSIRVFPLPHVWQDFWNRLGGCLCHAYRRFCW